MVIMILEAAPASLRGEVTRWLAEVSTGVFVGRVSAVVRDALWDRATERAGSARVMQIWSASNEQGFMMRVYGLAATSVVDIDGLNLIARKDAAWHEAWRRYGTLSASVE